MCVLGGPWLKVFLNRRMKMHNIKGRGGSWPFRISVTQPFETYIVLTRPNTWKLARKLYLTANKKKQVFAYQSSLFPCSLCYNLFGIIIHSHKLRPLIRWDNLKFLEGLFKDIPFNDCFLTPAEGCWRRMTMVGGRILAKGGAKHFGISYLNLKNVKNFLATAFFPSL